jgi:hypothetical protein
MAGGYTCGVWSSAMAGVDTVDRVIRNQRYRGWRVFVYLCIWGMFWMGSALALEIWLSPPIYYGFPWHRLLWLAWVVPMLASFIALLIRMDREPPKRLKLGDDLWSVPAGRVAPKDIRAFRFAHDPDEDYIESTLPIPSCELTVELHKRKLHLIVSFGDALRVREWAERHGVAVIDPEGYSTRWSRGEPDQSPQGA